MVFFPTFFHFLFSYYLPCESKMKHQKCILMKPKFWWSYGTFSSKHQNSILGKVGRLLCSMIHRYVIMLNSWSCKHSQGISVISYHGLLL